MILIDLVEIHADLAVRQYICNRILNPGYLTRSDCSILDEICQAYNLDDHNGEIGNFVPCDDH